MGLERTRTEKMVSIIFPSPCPAYVLPFSVLNSRCQCWKEMNHLSLGGKSHSWLSSPLPSCHTFASAWCTLRIGAASQCTCCFLKELLTGDGGKQEENLGVPTTYTLLRVKVDRGCFLGGWLIHQGPRFFPFPCSGILLGGAISVPLMVQNGSLSSWHLIWNGKI